jgi:hypothetical protein
VCSLTQLTPDGPLRRVRADGWEHTDCNMVGARAGPGVGRERIAAIRARDLFRPRAKIIFRAHRARPPPPATMPLHYKNDGTLDMRYKSSRLAAAAGAAAVRPPSSLRFSAPGLSPRTPSASSASRRAREGEDGALHFRKSDGKLDMRYSSSKRAAAAAAAAGLPAPERDGPHPARVAVDLIGLFEDGGRERGADEEEGDEDERGMASAEAEAEARAAREDEHEEDVLAVLESLAADTGHRRADATSEAAAAAAAASAAASPSAPSSSATEGAIAAVRCAAGSCCVCFEDLSEQCPGVYICTATPPHPVCYECATNLVRTQIGAGVESMRCSCCPPPPPPPPPPADAAAASDSDDADVGGVIRFEAVERLMEVCVGGRIPRAAGSTRPLSEEELRRFRSVVVATAARAAGIACWTCPHEGCGAAVWTDVPADEAWHVGDRAAQEEAEGADGAAGGGGAAAAAAAAPPAPPALERRTFRVVPAGAVGGRARGEGLFVRRAPTDSAVGGGGVVGVVGFDDARLWDGDGALTVVARRGAFVKLHPRLCLLLAGSPHRGMHARHEPETEGWLALSEPDGTLLLRELDDEGGGEGGGGGGGGGGAATVPSRRAGAGAGSDDASFSPSAQAPPLRPGLAAFRRAGRNGVAPARIVPAVRVGDRVFEPIPGVTGTYVRAHASHNIFSVVGILRFSLVDGSDVDGPPVLRAVEQRGPFLRLHPDMLAHVRAYCSEAEPGAAASASATAAGSAAVVVPSSGGAWVSTLDRRTGRPFLRERLPAPPTGLRQACGVCRDSLCARCGAPWDPAHAEVSCAAHDAATRAVAAREATAAALGVEGSAAGHKACPGCGTLGAHWRNHHCHHISPPAGGFDKGGCPECHTHYCFACLAVFDRADGWRGHYGNGPGQCRLFCGPECDCAPCPDCRPGRPCRFV